MDSTYLLESIIDNPRLESAVGFFTNRTRAQLLHILDYLITPQTTGEVMIENKLQIKPIKHGYYVFEKSKTINNKKNINKKPDKRKISIPVEVLKEAQKQISHNLKRIPISLYATGGEATMNHFGNAEPHRHNLFLYTTDISNAFPSVKTERVRNVFGSALAWTLKNSFPHLSDEEHKIFQEILVQCTVYDNQLPQGSPTSPRILNIVMAKLDEEIVEFLHRTENDLINPTYTRYVDDLAISFNGYGSDTQIKELIQGFEQSVGNFDQDMRARGPNALEAHIINQEGVITKFIDSVINTIPDFASKQQVDWRQNMLKIIRRTYIDLWKLLPNQDETVGAKKILWEAVGRIDHHNTEVIAKHKPQKFKKLAEGIRTIVRKNGRQIKETKDKMRYPLGPDPVREITGVCFNDQGKRGVVKKKLDGFVGLAYSLATDPIDGIKNDFKDETGAINHARVLATLRGIKNYLKKAYEGKDSIPRKFMKNYDEAYKRFSNGGKQNAKQENPLPNFGRDQDDEYYHGEEENAPMPDYDDEDGGYTFLED